MGQQGQGGVPESAPSLRLRFAEERTRPIFLGDDLDSGSTSPLSEPDRDPLEPRSSACVAGDASAPKRGDVDAKPSADPRREAVFSGTEPAPGTPLAGDAARFSPPLNWRSRMSAAAFRGAWSSGDPDRGPELGPPSAAPDMRPRYGAEAARAK